MSYTLTRSRFSYTSKLRTYITFPEFSIDNTWRGASQMIRKFNFSMTNPLTLLQFFSTPPAGVTFVPCVSWKPTSETIVRYKLWENVGEILYVPLYNGERIGADFSIEIWNTDNDTIEGGGYLLYTSRLIIPDEKCDDDDIEIGTDFDTCTDITFDPTDFTPSEGDYYVLNGTCGLTTLIEATVFDDDGWLIKADDGTWHRLDLIRLDGVTYTSLFPVADPVAGTREYLPLIDINSGAPFELRAYPQDNGGGLTTYHLYVGNFVSAADEANALGVYYGLADDGKYYGVRLLGAWDDYTLTDPDEQNSFIEVAQTETIP